MNVEFQDEPWFEGVKVFRTSYAQLDKELELKMSRWIFIPYRAGPFLHDETV